MFNLILRQRTLNQVELMDDPQCDAVKLKHTYEHFELINRMVSAWWPIYQSYIRPLKPETLLDIGCGGGDVARAIANWASKDGFKLAITAIDPNERALEFASSQASKSKIRFLKAVSSDLVKQNKRFDVVISNHVLHHLTAKRLLELCADSEKLVKRQVIHNDLRRSDLAYLGFSLTTPFFRNSFITPDGLLSIKRSFTSHELEALVPNTWQVKALIPYRNLLLYPSS